MSYSEHVPEHERPVISALLTAALKDGNTVSVFDCEEWSIKRSTSIRAIQAVLGATEEDLLVILNSAGGKIGQFYLIYNNGSVGDPMVVIADYSSNDFCENLYRPLWEKYS